MIGKNIKTMTITGDDLTIVITLADHGDSSTGKSTLVANEYEAAYPVQWRGKNLRGGIQLNIAKMIPNGK